MSAIAVAWACTPSTAQFVDWISVGDASATGTLGGVTVTFTGPLSDDFGEGVPMRDAWVTSDTSDQFNRDYFTPQLPLSDRMAISGVTSSPQYGVMFSEPVTNPVIHLSSLASVLTFDPGTSISFVSGQDTLIVAGNTVSGTLLDVDPPWRDSNGTVMLNGTFSSIDFTATYSFPGTDFVFMQIGSVPAPGAALALGLGGFPFTGALRRRRCN